MTSLPHRQKFLDALLKALSDLGGSGSVEEIREKVIANMAIPDALANEPRVSKRGVADGRTELEYELAWGRTQLKGLGYINNSQRGVWSIVKTVDPNASPLTISSISTQVQAIPNDDWRAELNTILTEVISPSAFERLIQRILRETGFVQVEVTGRTNDGGIDGKGIAKINGMLSFYVVFQAKRYKGSVSSAQVRDFRGAMVGRADKGLLITTGYFTREAIKEAVREGAPAIDLVDGEKLIEKLKSLSLGVNTELIESVSLDKSWFESL